MRFTMSRTANIGQLYTSLPYIRSDAWREYRLLLEKMVIRQMVHEFEQVVNLWATRYVLVKVCWEQLIWQSSHQTQTFSRLVIGSVDGKSHVILRTDEQSEMEGRMNARDIKDTRYLT